MSFHIRPYEAKDRHALEQLMTELQEHIVAIDPLQRHRCESEYGKVYVDMLLQMVFEKEGCTLVAVDGVDIVGCSVCILERQSDTDLLEVYPVLDGRIVELVVRRGMRGRGIGTALMQAAEAFCKNRGCDGIRVEVFSPNTDARRLYEKLGYSERIVDMLKVF